MIGYWIAESSTEKQTLKLYISISVSPCVTATITYNNSPLRCVVQWKVLMPGTWEPNCVIKQFTPCRDLSGDSCLRRQVSMTTLTCVHQSGKKCTPSDYTGWHAAKPIRKWWHLCLFNFLCEIYNCVCVLDDHLFIMTPCKCMCNLPHKELSRGSQVKEKTRRFPHWPLAKWPRIQRCLMPRKRGKPWWKVHPICCILRTITKQAWKLFDCLSFIEQRAIAREIHSVSQIVRTKLSYQLSSFCK